MTLLSFFGCLFVAYGPLLSIFFLFIAQHAQYVLLMLSSTFFCLIAFLLSSVIWYFSVPIQTKYAISIAYSVAIQEIGRLCFYLLYKRAEKGLNSVSASPQSPFNRHLFAFVAGVGYALTTSLVTYVSVLVVAMGPGTIMCPSCPQVSLPFINAVTTSLFSLLHMAWMMVAIEGYARWKTKLGVAKIAWVVSSHFATSFATLMNGSTIYLGCVYSIVVSLSVLAVTVTITASSLVQRYHLTGRSTRTQ